MADFAKNDYPDRGQRILCGSRMVPLFPIWSILELLVHRSHQSNISGASCQQFQSFDQLGIGYQT